jgi:hypothetical protein
MVVEFLLESRVDGRKTHSFNRRLGNPRRNRHAALLAAERVNSPH